MVWGIVAVVLLWIVLGYAFIRLRGAQPIGSGSWSVIALVALLAAAGAAVSSGAWIALVIVGPFALFTGWDLYRRASSRRASA